MSILDRLENVLVGIDQTFNALLGGSPRETLSGSVERAALAGKRWAIDFARPFINCIMMNPTHCQECAAHEALCRAIYYYVSMRLWANFSVKSPHSA